MTQSPIFLQPEFKERIWGGAALRETFGYDIPSDLTGECWAISAHPNGPNIVASGPYKGKTLAELWDEHRELFGGAEGDRFPLLTKILDANQDLSVQVHPDDYYAGEHENGELGKTECWYIIDCKEGAEIVYGHTARTRTELVTMINSGDWDNLLRRIKIKPGDFYYVPSGTIHALCEGTVVLETQQSSDTTYRVYDYDRADQNGEKRELHLTQAINVTTVPHVDSYVDESTETQKGITIKTFVEAEYFSVYKWEIDGAVELTQDAPFLLCSVIEGEGKLTQGGELFPISKGANFILPAETNDFTIEGTCELIVSHI
ncbi:MULTISPECIES: mannose-6-phosphate isomerase, class I [Bacillus]|uniref:Mannose-6-phosphate isomerase n=2 Tax=Bacillus paralicheniformis TaxID=1648923 RepID=A0ABY3FRD2_9BACI|nr:MULTISPECIES: mannose-6-phosphate isomerase, class I [Bacillus]MCU4670356.1 mannose-6-phosphate isomerase, class I [Bacillus paralicheniformis]MED1714026.1 mannose-6-phosphate isomerase, class I [Bacillus paralicheniformis]TWK38155.1 putative mannose-6-phosphate isomerase YvyI [Bacillus paralicheniformis]TWK81450.1 putative mannose-6-phosphate isomerase YvyI [Bacillus paralicheniformis]TWL34843.1 putative mannose-6-phosphate isomerase YvyI [Bacillus paralicheniformis]